MSLDKPTFEFEPNSGLVQQMILACFQPNTNQQSLVCRMLARSGGVVGWNTGGSWICDSQLFLPSLPSPYLSYGSQAQLYSRSVHLCFQTIFSFGRNVVIYCGACNLGRLLISFPLLFSSIELYEGGVWAQNIKRIKSMRCFCHLCFEFARYGKENKV